MYKNLFGDEWYSLLHGYFKSEQFKNIYNSLNYAYSRGDRVIPPKRSPLYFKAFKDLQPSKINVIVLGQDPFHDKGTYTGYAFDNANSSKLSPSLRNIFKEIDRTYPQNEDNIDYGIDRWDLSRWVRQGVFLVNAALSVIEGRPDSHTALWRPFTIEWITRLNENKDDLIWLLWGNKAQAYEVYITNPSHRIIKSGHPSPLNTSNPFTGSNCFIECNEDLVGRNKKEIIW
jgi:uracil-DNA glycosylase